MVSTEFIIPIHVDMAVSKLIVKMGDKTIESYIDEINKINYKFDEYLMKKLFVAKANFAQ